MQHLPSIKMPCICNRLPALIIWLLCTEATGGGDQTVNISCRGAALPNNMVRWMHNNAPINIDGVKFTTTPNGDRLTIRSVTGSDEGSYTCLYTNSQNQQVTDDSSCLFVLGNLMWITITIVRRHEPGLGSDFLYFDIRVSEYENQLIFSTIAIVLGEGLKSPMYLNLYWPLAMPPP